MKAAQIKSLILIISLTLISGLVSEKSYSSTRVRLGGKKRKTVKQLPDAQNNLLRSFDFSYQHNGDYHVKQIEVNPRTGKQVTLGFMDETSYPLWAFDGAFERIKSVKILKRKASGRCLSGGVCTKLLDKPSSDYVFALRGFFFKYARYDHHIKRISITERSGQLFVNFSDKNSDDYYHYTIQYAWVPKRFISTLRPQLRGRGAKKVAAVSIPRGKSFLRGFKVEFASKDHHLRNFGIEMTGSKMMVRFADKNGDDKFNWWVEYGYLK
jgi:hypothetical protein